MTFNGDIGEQRRRAMEEFLRKQAAQRKSSIPASRTKCMDVVAVRLTPSSRKETKS